LCVVDPLKQTHPSFHGYHLESPQEQLTLLAFAILVHNAVDDSKELLNTLIEPQILASLYQEHIFLLVTAIKCQSFRPAK
jgi:hypothetical protein